MSDATNQALSEAYELIEADRLTEAEAILKPILADEPDNADAWWIYSYAVTDVETARMALNTVLNLDSGYPGAAELLQTLEEKYPAHTTAKSDIRKLAPQPPSLPDLPEDEDMEQPVHYLEDSEPILARDRQMKAETTAPKSTRKPSRLPIYAGLVLLIILIIALLFLLSRRPGPSVTVTPTTAQQQAAVVSPTADQQQTSEAVAPTTEGEQTEVALAPTEGTEDASAEATVSPLDAEVTPLSDTAANSVQGALADFTLVDNGIGTLDTQLGTTLVAGVCTASGQQMRDTLAGSMDALSAVADTIGGSEAIGVRLVNCDTNEVLRVIAVPIADAAAYAAGQSNEETYQSKWVAVA